MRYSFKKFILLLMLTFTFCSTLFAEKISSLNPIEPLTVTSPLFPQGLGFNVTLPASYQKDSNKKYIVLVDFHPRSQPMLAGIHDWMAHNGEWPWLETIIVTRNWTFDETLDAYYTQAINKENEKLLDFIQKDLMPTIDKKYRTNGFRIFNGFTGNASLVLYTLMHRPNTFNAYIAASPILADNHFNISSDFTKKMETLTRPTYVFISTGKSNYEKAHVASFDNLRKQLKSVNNRFLTSDSQYFNDNYYMTQPVVATSNAIENIFNDYHQDLASDSDISKQGAEAIIAHYQYLSEQKYGFEVSALSSLKTLAFSLIKTDEKQALSILEKCIELYPNSAFSYSALAKAYFELNNQPLAVKYQKIAVEKTKSLIPWHQRNQQKILKQYQSM